MVLAIIEIAKVTGLNPAKALTSPETKPPIN
jgi:hypothetical protein